MVAVLLLSLGLLTSASLFGAEFEILSTNSNGNRELCVPKAFVCFSAPTSNLRHSCPASTAELSLVCLNLPRSLSVAPLVVWPPETQYHQCQSKLSGKPQAQLKALQLASCWLLGQVTSGSH